MMSMSQSAVALHIKRLLEHSGSSINGIWLSSKAGIPRVTLRRSFKDPVNGASKKTVQSWLLLAPQGLMSGGPPIPLGKDVVHVSPSPSGLRFALLKSFDDGVPCAKTKIVCELWDVESGSILREVVADGLHGSPLSDGWFSEGLAWSPCEGYVAYVAESVAPFTSCTEKNNFFQTLLPSCSTDKTSDPSFKKPGAGYLEEGSGKGASWGSGGREDWGEKYVSVRSPRPFVCDWEKGMVYSVPGIPEDVSAGQPIFVPNTSPSTLFSLVFTGWRSPLRRLGLIHCFNRPCSLYFTSMNPLGASQSEPLPSTARILTPPSINCRSPRISPDGQFFAFLASPHKATMLTHNGPSYLQFKHTMRALEGGISVNDISVDLEVHAGSLPLSPWASGGRTLFVNSSKGIEGTVVEVVFNAGLELLKIIEHSMKSKQFSAQGSTFSGGSDAGDLRFWASTEEHCVFSLSTPTSPERLFIEAIDSTSSPSTPSIPFAEIPLQSFEPGGNLSPGDLPVKDIGMTGERTTVFKHLASLKSVTLSVFPPLSTFDSDAIQSSSSMLTPAPDETTSPFHCTLLYPPMSGRPVPLVIVPHGGPHSNFSSAFSPHYAALASFGYAVLLINYRGSTGYPLPQLVSLPGRCGTNDVSDCFQATLYALALGGCDRVLPLLDSRNRASLPDVKARVSVLFKEDGVGVSGGSHGGFIAAHLISNPFTRTLFKTAVLRNPVFNISTMVSSTDIPDWCFVEALGCGSGQAPSSLCPDTLKAMFSCSPCAMVECLLPQAPTSGTGIKVDYSIHSRAVKTTDAIGGSLKAGGVSAPNNAFVSAPHTHTTPFLLMLGLKDRRVPPSQGLEMFHAVRTIYAREHSATGEPPDDSHLQLLVYPEDTHALDSPTTDGDSWVHLTLWLNKHLHSAV